MHYVPAFHGGNPGGHRRAPGVCDISPVPDWMVVFDKAWVVAVDASGVHRLTSPHRPVHWVQGETAGKPGGRVTGIHRIRERRDDEVVRVRCGCHQGLLLQGPVVPSCEISEPQTCGQVVNQCCRCTLHEKFIQPVCNRCSAAGCLQGRGGQFPSACPALADTLFKEVCEVTDPDSLLLHQAGELVMFNCRPVNPEYVVKEE